MKDTQKSYLRSTPAQPDKQVQLGKSPFNRSRNELKEIFIFPEDMVQKIVKDQTLLLHPDLRVTKHPLFARSESDIEYLSKQDAFFTDLVLRNPEVITNNGIPFPNKRFESLRITRFSITIVSEDGIPVSKIGVSTFEAVAYSMPWTLK